MQKRFLIGGQPFWTPKRILGFGVQVVARLAFFYTLPMVLVLFATVIWFYPEFFSHPSFQGALTEVLSTLHPSTQFWLVFAWHFFALSASTLSWLFWPWPSIEQERCFE